MRSVAAMLKPNPALMVDNPLSKIPTLVREDGSTLFDSIVICEYLNDQAGGSLFPTQGEARWQALRWHALGDGLLDVLILWRNEREREHPLRALADAFELKTRASLKLLDAEADVDRQRAVLHRPRDARLRAGLSRLPLRRVWLACAGTPTRRLVCDFEGPPFLPIHGARRWLRRDGPCGCSQRKLVASLMSPAPDTAGGGGGINGVWSTQSPGSTRRRATEGRRRWPQSQWPASADWPGRAIHRGARIHRYRRSGLARAPAAMASLPAQSLNIASSCARRARASRADAASRCPTPVAGVGFDHPLLECRAPPASQVRRGGCGRRKA